jgi:hypothetical protein
LRLKNLTWIGVARHVKGFHRRSIGLRSAWRVRFPATSPRWEPI